MKTDNVSKIWKDILPSGVELYPHEKVFFSDLVQLAANSKRILEVGVGKARMVELIKKACSTSGNFYAVDLNWHQNTKDISFAVADTRNLPFQKNAFDLTYSLGVVEHMPCPETAIAVQEHIRVTRPGGYILITTPAKSIIFTPIRHITYYLKFRRMGTFMEVEGRNVNKEELIKVFLQENCFIMGSGRSGIYIPKLPRSMRRIITNLVPSQIGAYLWILAQKR